MSPSSVSYESNAFAERRAQKALNEKVGDRLPKRTWWQRRKWRSRMFRNSNLARVEA